jgi:hypothetical protein
MRTVVVRILLVVPLLFTAPVVWADNVDTGDFVKFVDRNGSPGGEFGLRVSDTPGGSLVDFFVTFCLQKTEYIDFNSTFIVGSITDHTLTDPNDKGGVNGADPISSKTAWLYTQFRKQDYGALGVLGYNGSTSAANALQNAFWYFEDELTQTEKNQQANNIYVKAAKEAVSSGAWSGIGSVRVLNLYKYDKNNPSNWRYHEAQDQLVLVPEPSSLGLLTSGVFALFVARRRKSTV